MIRQICLIWSLAGKDWKLFLADRRAAVMCFVVPILLGSAFGLIFDRPDQRNGRSRLPVLVVAEDDSPATRAIVDDLRASENLEIREVDRLTAEKMISSRECGVAIILPTGFGTERGFQEGRKPALEMLHHPLAAMESQWAEGAFTEVVMRRKARAMLEPLGMQAAADRPFEVRRQSSANDSEGPFNTYSHSFSGMTLQYLLFWGMECGLLLLRERQRGIWSRLMSAPVPLTTALLGRGFATAMIAILQFACTFGFGWLFFGVKVSGSMSGFLLLAAGVSLLAAGLGLLIAALGRTEACARSLFIVVILAASMLGGLWIPTFLLPEWVRNWSLVLPTSWAMRGLDGATWQGQGLAKLWPSLLAVYLFAAVFLLLALIRFHWSESRRRYGGIA
ncbi:MAG: ABC transporter permease [Planctomycetes bacterium]|nr:ABC transporter permease [Planctomycetota bacterium]